MDVFVYGTLTEHATTAAILDDYEYCGAAELVGLHRVDGRYPTLAPGGTTAGRLLATPEIDRLDSYEGVDRGLYCRQTVPQRGADGTIDCYIGNPGALQVDIDWPGTGEFRERVDKYCTDHEVLVRREETEGD